MGRQANPNDLYGGQAYHALTWLIYSLSQQGDHQGAQERLALIERQVEQYGDESAVVRRHFVGARASYIIDTLQWDNHYAGVEIDHDGLPLFSIATDHYVQGVVALKRGDTSKAQAALAAMGGETEINSTDRETMAPLLLRLALEGQMALAAGQVKEALELIGKAAELEGQLPAEYLSLIHI